MADAFCMGKKKNKPVYVKVCSVVNISNLFLIVGMWMSLVKVLHAASDQGLVFRHIDRQQYGFGQLLGYGQEIVKVSRYSGYTWWTLLNYMYLYVWVLTILEFTITPEALHKRLWIGPILFTMFTMDCWIAQRFYNQVLAFAKSLVCAERRLSFLWKLILAKLKDEMQCLRIYLQSRRKTRGPKSLEGRSFSVCFNSFGAKFQTTFVVCFFF